MRTLWNRLPTAGRIALLLGALIAATTPIAIARRDLAARDPSAVRGNPDIWDKVTRLPGGATAYLLAGRRPEPKSA
jgi:hypothetical protein